MNIPLTCMATSELNMVFSAFDYNRTGYISPSVIYGLLTCTELRVGSKCNVIVKSLLTGLAIEGSLMRIIEVSARDCILADSVDGNSGGNSNDNKTSKEKELIPAMKKHMSAQDAEVVNNSGINIGNCILIDCYN